MQGEMEKTETVTIEDCDIPDDCLSAIRYIAQKAAEMEAAGCKKIEFELECGPRHSAYITLKGKRPETEAEKSERLDKQARARQENLDHERATYERLKRKFEAA